MVGVSTARKDDKTVYGAVLYLDGRRVNGKKTFTSRTIFQGFKQGGGRFLRFDFNTSNVGMSLESNSFAINDKNISSDRSNQFFNGGNMKDVNE